MPASQVSGDMTVFTVNSGALLAVIQGVTLTVDNESADGGGVARMYKSAQLVKSGYRVSASVMSVQSGITKVANLDVSAFAIGGTSYLATLRGGSLKCDWTHVEASGVGDRWRWPQGTKKDLTLDANINVPTAGLGLADLLDGAVSGMSLVGTVTINSIAFTFDGLLTGFTHEIPVDGIQNYKVTLQGRDDGAGNSPDAPTGTSTLIETVLNGPAGGVLSGVAFTLTTHASAGETYTGTMIPSSATINFNDAGIQTIDYEWVGQGALAVA